MVEAKKLAFADREQYVADPDWVDIPLEGLLSKEYAAAARRRDRPAAGRRRRRRRPAGPVRRHHLLLHRRPRRQRRLRAAEHPVRLWRLPDRRRDRHPAQQPHDLLAPGRRTSQLSDARQACAPHHEPGHRHQGGQALPGLRHARRRHAGADQPATQSPTCIDFGMNPQEAVEAPRWRSLQNPMDRPSRTPAPTCCSWRDAFPEPCARSWQHRGHELEILGDWDASGRRAGHPHRHGKRRADRRLRPAARRVCDGMVTVRHATVATSPGVACDR